MLTRHEMAAAGLHAQVLSDFRLVSGQPRQRVEMLFGAHLSEVSQIAPSSLFPNLRPSDRKSSGNVSPAACGERALQ